MRSVVRLGLAVLAAGVFFSVPCCSDDGKTLTGTLEVLDVGVADRQGEEGVYPDGRVGDAQDLPDGAAPDKAVPADSDAVLPGDSDGGGGGDQAGDDVDAGPDTYVPFSPCTKSNPECPSKGELCLLLPQSEEGLCLIDCSKGEACPPWMECVLPDKGNPALKVCLELAPPMAPCDNKKGVICQSNYPCIFPPGSESGVCTQFCNLKEAVCGKGAVCTIVEPDDPEVDWGACLEQPDWPECKEVAECAAGTTCVELKQVFRCAPKCVEPGSPCGVQGTCAQAPLPDGTSAAVCLVIQVEGEICSTAKGLSCKEGLVCVDLGAPDGWRRCVLPCPEGGCGQEFVCMPVASIDGVEACVPLELANPAAVLCNDKWPCKEAGQECVPFPAQAGGGKGVCMPACGAGCAGGTSCVSGGCVTVVPEGGTCLEASGVFCASPAKCIRDPAEKGAGWCAMPCKEGGPCGEGKACVSTSLGEDLCLVPGTQAELCSLDDGLGCDTPAGLTCLHVTSDSDYGFCTAECAGQGSCAQVLPDSLAECMIKKGDKWYCAYLCGGMGSCPAGMNCMGIGICSP